MLNDFDTYADDVGTVWVLLEELSEEYGQLGSGLWEWSIGIIWSLTQFLLVNYGWHSFEIGLVSKIFLIRAN